MDKKWYDSCEFNLDYLNGVLLDYCSSVEDFIRELSFYDDRYRLDNWVFTDRGRYNYSLSALYMGKSEFFIAWNPSNSSTLVPSQDCNNIGLFISLSGKGLAQMQHHSNTLPSFIKYLYNNGFRCSRFDVNCDIYDPDNDIVPLLVSSIDKAIVREEGAAGLICDLKRTNLNFRVIPITDTDTGERFYNAYVGQHGTGFGMFRCYNKKIEVKEKNCFDVAAIILDKHGNPDYWYRLEYEVHKENAAKVFNSFASGKINLPGSFFACAERFFTPVVQCGAFKNYSRDSSVSIIWSTFLEYLSLFISSNSGIIQVFTHEPYIPKGVDFYKDYCSNMSPILALGEIFKALDPEWYNKNVLSKGEEALLNKPKYAQLRSDFCLCSTVNSPFSAFHP